MAVLSSGTRNDAVGARQLPQIHLRALRFIKEQRQFQEEIKLSCAQNCSQGSFILCQRHKILLVFSHYQRLPQLPEAAWI